MSFAKTIKEVRQKCIMSQEEFATTLGVSFSTVNRWESGKSLPNYQTMKKIKEFCREHKIYCPDSWEEE